MAFHGFLDVPAVEIALEGQQREIHCVDGNNAPRCSDRL